MLSKKDNKILKEVKVLVLIKSFVLTLSMYLIFYMWYVQSCFVSKETTDITVTRGTLSSDKV